MAARRARAAAGRDAADRRADGVCRERPGRTGLLPRSGRDSRSSGGRKAATSGSTFAGRHRDVESIQRFAKELVALQPDLILSHNTPTTAALAATNAHHPHHFRDVSDPVGSGFVASFPRPGGNVTGFINMESDDGRQVAGVAQGDCAARRPGRVPVQPGNGTLRRILPEPLQSRRCVLRSGGDRSPVRDTSELESAIAAQAREPNGGLS